MYSTSRVRRVNLWVAGLSALTVAGCTGSDIEVTSFWGPDKPLGGMPATYEWALPGDWVAKNHDLDRLLREQIDAELVRKNYRQGARADLQVRYRTRRYTEQAEVGHESWEEGALAIELTDTSKGTLMWRGTAKARIDFDAPPEKSRELLSAAVHQVLKELPDASR